VVGDRGCAECRECIFLAGTEVAPRVDVPEDRRFLGFNASRDALDTLRPGDTAIFTTPYAARTLDKLHYA